MTKKPTYSDLLKDPRWQKKRLEILQRDNWKCFECGDTTNTLHVHHEYYKKNRKPWDYPLIAYKTLCEMCHEIAHERFIPKSQPEDKTAEYCKKVIPHIVDLFSKFPPNNFLSRILDKIVERSEK